MKSDTSLAVMDRRKWLLRLISVRLVVFSVLIGVHLLTGKVANLGDMVRILAAVYALSACWLALVRLNAHYAGQAYAQIVVDLILITWTVNRTGGVDSYFSSLYFLEIVMSSILLERRGAFIAGTLSSILHFAHLDLVKFGVFPSTGGEDPDWSELQFIISLNIFGFCAVAYLTNYLSENWRRTGAQLEKSTGQIVFLQAFSDRIVDSMASGLVTTDAAGRIYLFNRAAEDITGCRSDDALRMTIRELFPEIGKVEASRFETWTKRTNGRETYLRFSVSPVMLDDKDTAGYVWCIDDLTELRLLERQVRQKEQMAAIGAMSAGIAHEIRNPLASITGSFNLLQSDIQLNSDQSRLAEIITRETERLNRTINDFLSYARLPSPRPQKMNLASLISETVSLIRNSPELKDFHAIETRLQPVDRPVDESMMRQVFYNLATNAFKAMPRGGTLTIVLEARNGAAQIRFEDTGIGMDEDEVRKLFVPFHSSFKNGTGLGLPIVYQIVTAHNGTISVKSRKGAGATFTIDL